MLGWSCHLAEKLNIFRLVMKDFVGKSRMRPRTARNVILQYTRSHVLPFVLWMITMQSFPCFAATRKIQKSNFLTDTNGSGSPCCMLKARGNIPRWPIVKWPGVQISKEDRTQTALGQFNYGERVSSTPHKSGEPKSANSHVDFGKFFTCISAWGKGIFM